MVKIASVLILSAAFAAAHPARANERFHYTRESTKLFEVVVASEEGDTKREPGIYFLDQVTGEPNAVVLGEVLGANQVFPGIMAYGSPSASQTSAHDAMAIVNGELVLFNRYSSPTRPGSTLVIGDVARGVPVEDLVQGGTVRLPKITSAQDVVVRSGHNLIEGGVLPHGGNFLMVSLKAPTLFGDGLTFAFVLESKRQGRPTVYGGRVSLISHTFFKTDKALGRLIHHPTNANMGMNLLPQVSIYAPNMIARFKTQIGRKKSPVVNDWIDQLTRFENFLTRDQEPDAKVSAREMALGAPTWDFLKGQEELPMSPIETVAENPPLVFGQVFNHVSEDFGIIQANVEDFQPVTIGRRTMRFLSTEVADSRQIARQPVDRDFRTNRHLFFAQAADGVRAETDPAYLFFSKKRTYLMASPLNGGKASYQTLELKNPVLEPTDKIEFLRRPVRIDDHNGSVLIIHRRFAVVGANQRSRIDRSSVHSVLIDEHNGLRILAFQELFEGSGLSFEEMRQRLVAEAGEIYFDSVTKPRGAKYYRPDDTEINEFGEAVEVNYKTTPYETIMRDGGKPKQTWLRSLIDHVVVPDVLAYREFNENGAREPGTGLYLTVTDPDKQSESELRGVPLNNYTGRPEDNPEYALLSRTLYQPFGMAKISPNVQLTIVPYDPLGTPRALLKPDPKKKAAAEEPTSFKLAVLFNADRVGGSQTFRPQLKSLHVEAPPAGLQFAQIIQGTKNRANETSILLFFRADPKIPNTRDEVWVSTATMAWNPNLVGDRFALQLPKFERLHEGLVMDTSLQAHLRVNAEGSFFWVTDPNADRNSGQYRVIKLSHAAQGAIKSGSAFSDLREPDEIRQTDIGHVGGKRRVGGRWEMPTALALVESVHGLREESERRLTKTSAKRARPEHRAREEAATPGGRPLPSLGDGAAEHNLLAKFERALDKLATPGPAQLRRPRVFVVDPALKEKFKWTLFTKLALDTTPFSLQNSKLRFFHANPNLDDVEVAEELQHIRETANDKVRILYVDPSQLKADGKLEMREYAGDADGPAPATDAPTFFPHDDPRARGNMLVLLASGGLVKSEADLQKLADRPAPIPMVSVVTPEEWDEIQRKQTREIQAGVLDDVTVDHDFLTTSWTVWPPRADRSAEDANGLRNRPYRAEEMRVFPTLDRILNQAATGELKGKKKIILVPDDLKKLVKTLVMVRWSTPEAVSGAWSFRNPDLALAQISGDNMKYQTTVLENFKGLRGAANSRHAVLYSDLETVLKFRRPDQDPHQRPIFRLRDPVRGRKDGMFGEFDGAPAADARETAALDPGDQPQPHFEDQLHNPDDEEEFDFLKNVMASEDDTASLDALEKELSANNDEIARLSSKLDTIETFGSAADSTEVLDVRKDIASRRSYRERLRAMQHTLEDNLKDGVPLGEAHARASTDLAPHLMWWIAAEGHPKQPEPRSGWSIGSSIDRQVASILVGTPEEYEKLKTELTAEAKYFNLDEEFEVTTLEAPSDETKFNLVSDLFDRSEVLSLRLKFQTRKDLGLDPKAQLIHHFNNGVDQLAYDKGIDKTTAFIRAYVALQNALTEDVELFAHRTISERFIERLFTRVFPMPLNRDILEPNDPLNRLANQDFAVRELQAAGVEGSPKLKRSIFDTILSQTRPTDTSRPIPNSQILFGPTSTGKTWFLKRLFHMLNFVEYQAGKGNEDADYIFINVSKLTGDNSTGSADSNSVDEAITSILDLLAQPKGTRAHILLDDYQSQNKVVREKLYQFLRGLFDAPGGMMTVRSRANPQREIEIPIQNLNLYMTINPSINEATRRNYVKPELKGNEKLKREILAAIAGDGFSPEESFLARWGAIIDMDKFPRSAKVPELVKRVRATQPPNGQMVMVDPSVIFKLIDSFSQAHARDLLNPATSALTAIPGDLEDGPIYIVTNDERKTFEQDPGSAGSVTQDLAKAVRSFTRVETIKVGDPVGLLSLMGFVMHNFRLQIYNGLVIEASQGDALHLPRPKARNILRSNFLLGITSHVLDHGQLPTGELVLRPEQFQFYQKSHREELMRRHEVLRTGKPSYFPIEMDAQARTSAGSLDNFLSGFNLGFVEERGRRHVLADTVIKIEKLLARMMAIYLRIPSSDQLTEIGGWGEAEITRWFVDLPEKEPVEVFAALRVEMITLFQEFEQAINNPDLEDYGDIDLYSQVRLFGFAIDKAITRLPWGHIANFVVNVASASADSSLGPRPTFRNYVSKQDLSAFGIGTSELMAEMLDQTLNDNGQRDTREGLKRLKQKFSGTCDELLRSARSTP